MRAPSMSAPFLFDRALVPRTPRSRALLPALLFLLTLAPVYSVQTAAFSTIGTGPLVIHNATVRTHGGNSACIIIGCDSRTELSDADQWWNYYRKSGYVTTQVRFQNMTHGRDNIPRNWCKVVTAMRELRRKPGSRVLFTDTDTLVDFKRWCEVPGLGEEAPIIMNSLHRNNLEISEGFTVQGSQVQSNAFLVSPGIIGLNALKRWENSYNTGIEDQAALSKQEGMLCGVPGWIHCTSNAEQAGCHCTGSPSHGMSKKACIERLFNKTLHSCILD